jgi:hypothetical protein
VKFGESEVEEDCNAHSPQKCKTLRVRNREAGLNHEIWGSSRFHLKPNSGTYLKMIQWVLDPPAINSWGEFGGIAPKIPNK